MLNSNRWKDYQLLVSDEISSYFSSAYTNEKVLFILGEGFDRRMCNGLSKIRNILQDLTIWKIKYSEASDSSSTNYSDMRNDNIELFNNIAEGCPIEEFHIKMWDETPQEKRYVAEINAHKLVMNLKDKLSSFSNIIIDISSLPLSLYFPIVYRMINEHFEQKKNFFIFVTENYLTDTNIQPVELGEKAHAIHGFIGTSNAANDEIVVWFPILGETDPETLEKYYNYIKETYHRLDEICPVLPFPSVDVRRSDLIIDSYRSQLFSRWEIEKRNIIYASENNPFQVNRKIFEVASHYCKAMEPIGKCRFIISTITSKLMSIGALLAAIELKNNSVSIQCLNISNKGYNLLSEPIENEKIGSDLYCLCLSDKGY